MHLGIHSKRFTAIVWMLSELVKGRCQNLIILISPLFRRARWLKLVSKGSLCHQIPDH